MAVYLYLSMIPEALIASMLPPDEFGAYFAVGTEKKARGQAMYITVDPSLKSDWFPLADVARRCVAHADGQPKHSVYLSVYRVLEHVPLAALGTLSLATRDGRVLGIEPTHSVPALRGALHLYQEICPVDPRVVSTLDPAEFASFMTDRARSIRVPRIFFGELALGELAGDPEEGSVRDLPYPSIEHLRDCLLELKKAPGKGTKTVDRMAPVEFPYRTVKNGFFVGGAEDLLYYPMPAEKALQSTYYVWWRSASQ
jgi:hypothetical protein